MAKPRPDSPQQSGPINNWIKTRPKADRPRLREAQRKLCELFKEEDRSNLEWCYRVGSLVLKFLPDRKLGEGEGPRGQSVMEKLTRSLPGGYSDSRRRFLWHVRKFASLYTPQDARRLARRHLTLEHVKALMAVDAKRNTKTRDRFEKLCTKGGWSGHRLRREVQNDRRWKVGLGGRRPTPSPTTSPAVAVRDIIVLSRRWMVYGEVWLGDGKSPLKAVQSADHSEMLLEEVKKASGAVREVRDSAADVRRSLESLRKKIKATLSAG